MELYVKGVQVPMTTAVVIDSLDQIYTVIQVFVPNIITEQFVTLKDKKEIKCRVLRANYANNLYEYTLVSEKTWSLLNTNCEAFTGNADVNTLLKAVGINQNINLRTNKVDWVIPKIKFKVLLQYLNKYTSVQSGAAPRFYVDIDGMLSCVDFKIAYNSNIAEDLKCIVTKDFATMDWVIEHPGTVDIIRYTKDGISIEQLKEGPGTGIVRLNDTTGKAVDQVKQRLRNEFYTDYYTSRRITATESRIGSKNYDLGTLVQIQDVKQKFIIFSRSISIPIHGEAPHITLTLCAPWQKL